MKALVYEGQRRVSIQEITTPEPGAGELLIAVEACGLCGSDIAKIDANLRGPVPLGHEVSGTVAALGRGVKGFKKGDRVAVSHHVPCLDCHYCRKGNESMCREFKVSNLVPGGFAQFTLASEGHARHTVLKFPASVPFSSAAMMEPTACCLRNIRRLGLEEDDLAVILGLGFIGLLTAKLLRLRGVSALGVDLDPARVRAAQKFGLEEAFTGKDGRLGELIAEKTGGRGADAVIFTAGPSRLVADRFDWVRDGGTLNIFAGYPGQPSSPIDLDAVYHRELRILASYSPALEDLREAQRLIISGELDFSRLLRDSFPLDDFDEALRRVRGREVLKAVLLPQRVRQEAAKA